MKTFLVKSRHYGVTPSGAESITYKQQTITAENAAQAIVKANNRNGEEWSVVAVYEQIWHN